MIFNETTGRVIIGAVYAVIAGGGYHLGKQMGLWTSRRRVFFFFWASFAIPLLIGVIDIGINDSWVGAAVVFIFAMLTGGPAGAYFMSIYFFSVDNPAKTKKNLKKPKKNNI